MVDPSTDPLCLIPLSHKPQHSSDYPPWFATNDRVRDENHKAWKHRYKFFSHCLAHKREKEFCQYFGNMSGEEMHQRANKAQVIQQLVDEQPAFDKSHLKYERTMARIIENLQAKEVRPKHMSEPLWPKYKYAHCGRERVEADYHKEAQDPLHHFKEIDRHVPTVPTRRLGASSTDVCEIAAAKLTDSSASKKKRDRPRRSQSESALKARS